MVSDGEVVAARYRHIQMAENHNIYTLHTNTIMEHCHTAHNINSPDLAKELNANGMEIVQRRLQQQGGDDDDDDNNSDNSKIVVALQLHREALSIYEWNKRNALLYDHVEQSKEYAIEMACTLGIIGNLLRRMNDFVGAAGTCTCTRSIIFSGPNMICDDESCLLRLKPCGFTLSLMSTLHHHHQQQQQQRRSIQGMSR